MEKLKVAVIGLGKMGLLHSSILSTIAQVEIVAVCEKSFLLRRFAKKIFTSSKVVDDLQKLHDLHLDAIYVTTPIPTHFPILNAIFSLGIARNVFVEKTLASSWDKANELCALAEKLPGSNMVGYMKRFSSTFSKARNLLVENAIGELTSFSGFAFSSDFSSCNQSSKSHSRGGVLSDLGSHVIDLALWFFGDLKVEEAKINSIGGANSEDIVNFKVSKSGLAGEFSISWCKDNYRLPSFGLIVKGNNGTLSVNDFNLVLEHASGKRSIWYKPDLSDNVPFLLGDSEYYREDEHFVKSILNNCNAEPNFWTASKVDYTIDQVKKEASHV